MAANPSTGSFRDLLRRHRLAVGLSQEELAERAGLSARGISDLERGVNRTPQRETVQRLADALALTGEARAGFDAAAHGSGLAGRLAEATSPGLLSPLPAPLTALVGRERDMLSLIALLQRSDVRLVTLTGPGGVGKTRLALALAAKLTEAFPDGVIFVSLASLGDPGLVLSALAQSMGLRAGGHRSPADTLTAHLRGKRLLVVLDNFEHLLPAAPEVAALLEACPQLTVLATSRAGLRLRGEREIQVQPLALPDPQRALTAEQLGELPRR